jgi:protein-arginine kinase activator protein McsA
MKICTICKKEKELIEFNKNKSRKDGLNTLCKQCSQKRSKKYYKENLEEHRVVVRNRTIQRRKLNQEKLLEFLKDQTCRDCGTNDYRVFEFDHINNDKFRNVSQLVVEGYGWDKIKTEMNKCEVVCANCHRIRTFTRQDNYRLFKG